MSARADQQASAIGRHVSELETPALVVDLERLAGNLAAAAGYARAHDLDLYPHAKTHKTVEIAALQLAHGAGGLTVAKSSEAELFAEALDAALVLHYPVIGPEKVKRVVRVAQRVPLTVALDSLAAAEPIAAALRRRGLEVDALVELDVGLARTGLDPVGALELAREIESLGGGLRVAGLSCYPGHLRYDAAEIATGLEAVAARVGEALALFASAGMRAERVSGGSTATLFDSHRAPFTELRPGNYALLDRHEARGTFSLADTALHVHATVVSTSVSGGFIVDAGAKTLSEAGPPPGRSGHATIVGHDELELAALSEEHGHGVCRDGEVSLAVGDRLELVPNHACTCVNLHDVLYAARNGIVEEELQVLARGAVR